MQGSSQIERLPKYLPVQMMRFYFKVDVRQKAKILRKVSSDPMEKQLCTAKALLLGVVWPEHVQTACERRHSNALSM